MLESQLQVIVDGLVRNLAEQRKIRHTNLLLLRGLEDSLPDLGLSPALSTVAHISDCLGATESALLLPTTYWTT